MHDFRQQPLYELFREKTASLKNEFPVYFEEIDLTFTQKATGSSVKCIKNGHILVETTKPELSREAVVGFFLRLRELLYFIDLFNGHTQRKSIFLNEEALYEYPHLNRDGEFFVYISDKKTGNRNPFYLNLNTYVEKEIVIPGTSEYFPVMSDNRIFFITGDENHNILYNYDINKEALNQLYSGIIYCLRIENDYLFFIEEGNILKLSFDGTLMKEYPIDERIQSFCVMGTSIYYSVLNGTHYVIKRYDISNEKKEITLKTNNNIVDVINIRRESLLFSSNMEGSYDLYTYNLSDKKTEILYKCDEDIFYPFYSEIHNLIVFSKYKRDVEPKIEAVEYRQ